MKPASNENSNESFITTNENALPSDFLVNSNLRERKRQVLGDKTPMKGKNCNLIMRGALTFADLKRPLNSILSPSPQSKSPLKQVLSTPIPSTHPILRDITNSAKALKNPPDLFPATNTIKRSRRLQRKAAAVKEELKQVKVKEAEVTEVVDNDDDLIPSKLATTVFPADPEDQREIEHAISKLVDDEDAEELKGPSKIIPELKDLSKNLIDAEGEFERRCSIEVIEVPFIVTDDHGSSE